MPVWGVAALLPRVQVLLDQVLAHTDTGAVSGDEAVARFSDVHVLAPRGRFDVDMFHGHVNLAGQVGAGAKLWGGECPLMVQQVRGRGCGCTVGAHARWDEGGVFRGASCRVSPCWHAFVLVLMARAGLQWPLCHLRSTHLKYLCTTCAVLSW